MPCKAAKELPNVRFLCGLGLQKLCVQAVPISKAADRSESSEPRDKNGSYLSNLRNKTQHQQSNSQPCLNLFFRERSKDRFKEEEVEIGRATKHKAKTQKNLEKLKQEISDVKKDNEDKVQLLSQRRDLEMDKVS